MVYMNVYIYTVHSYIPYAIYIHIHMNVYTFIYTIYIHLPICHPVYKVCLDTQKFRKIKTKPSRIKTKANEFYGCFVTVSRFRLLATYAAIQFPPKTVFWKTSTFFFTLLGWNQPIQLQTGQQDN